MIHWACNWMEDGLGGNTIAGANFSIESVDDLPELMNVLKTLFGYQKVMEALHPLKVVYAGAVINQPPQSKNKVAEEDDRRRQEAMDQEAREK